MRIFNHNKVLVRTRFIFAFLAALSLSAWTPDYSKYDDDQRISRITWRAACRISHYELCPEERPAVRRSPILGERMSARGVYWLGTPVVWLDSPQRGTQQWLTTFHEQVHFIQYVNGVSVEGYDRDLRCLIEREALDFTNAYALELGRPELQRTLEVWQELYNCGPKTSTKSLMGTH